MDESKKRNYIQKQFKKQIDQGQKLKKEYSYYMGDVTNNEKKPELIDKPMYEELNKIPVRDQLEMINQQIDFNKKEEINNPNIGKPLTEEEKKQIMLHKLFRSKGERSV